ncbi:MAG: class II aldolase/adducin family protein [Burkholderiales bacterium]
MASVLNEFREAVRDKTSLRGRVSPEEWRTRVDLAAAHRLAIYESWQEGYSIFNHLTARVPGEPDMMLIKPHDLLFSEITASNLTKISISGKPMGFDKNINAAGWAIHSGVFQARPDVNASMHVHGPEGMAISVLKDGLMMVNQEIMRFYNRIGYHDFEGVAAPDERERLARDLGKHSALILRNHGVLTVGPTIGAAVLDLGLLMRGAKAQLAFLATGKEIIQPSAEICEETAKFSERSKEGATSWRAVKRYIDSKDTSYAE